MKFQQLSSETVPATNQEPTFTFSRFLKRSQRLYTLDEILAALRRVYYSRRPNDVIRYT